jgi:hypothetical protein
MCYSAQIKSDYRKYVRAFGGDLSLRDYFDIFWRRQADSRIKVPKAMRPTLPIHRTTRSGRSGS